MNKLLDDEHEQLSSTDLYHKGLDQLEDVAIILLDKDGIIVNLNSGAKKITLYDRKDIIGKHFSLIYPTKDIETKLPEAFLQNAAKSGKAIYEGWRVKRDGSGFWAQISATALYKTGNEVIGFLKVMRDNTHEKNAENKLKLSEERYHQMIAEIEDYAIIFLNTEGIIENWNLGAQKIKGYSSEEVLGKKISIFYTPEDLEQGLPDKLLKEAKESGRAVHEGWRIRKDGSRFRGTIVITALHNNQNELIGFCKITRDLTEQKASQDKLAAYTQELERKNEELERFAYIASHDLQEPLRKIQMFSDMIERVYDNKAAVAGYLSKLKASAKRMGQLVQSVLHYSITSRHDSGLTTVDLNDVIGNVQSDLELLIKEKQAVIITDTLPTVLGNNIELGQVFSNIVGNALKFSQTAPEVIIRSSFFLKDNDTNLPSLLSGNYYHCISISDNGIGFEQQYDEMIFSLFQRLHGQHEYSGTGIGLALCRRIVEKCNGCITAKSEPGKGSTFYIYLPVIDS